MKTPILILEDDIHIAKEIATRLRLARLGDPVVTHTEADCRAALRTHTFALAILDVDLPGNPEAGLQIAQDLNGVPFLFLSGHAQKRFAAYELGPQAFLSKPFDNNTMNSIELALLRGTLPNPPTAEADDPYFTAEAFFVFHQNAHHKVQLRDILFVRLEDGCLAVQTTGACYHIWVTLEHFLEQLLSRNIVRIHRSHAINLAHLTRFSAEEIDVGGYTLPVSKAGLRAINAAVRKIQSKRK